MTKTEPARIFCAFCGLVVTLACGVGNVAFQEGRKAEMQKDWDSALVNYEKAVQSNPENALYLLHEKQARTQASLLHLKNGRRLVKDGRPEAAAAEFQKAASIDPSNEAAATAVQLGTLSYRDYAAVLPSIYATAVLNDSKTHILQSPQVRATDGQTAKLKIGSRVPYATGSFLPSLTSTSSTSSTSLLASTQFQYQDVGVNLELTPHLLASGEIAIHAKIEISSLGADITVGGVSEPTFGQRVIEHDIRLREGEVNLLGGLLQSTQTSQVQGIPGLGSLPVLHYFFSQDYKEVNDVEVLVMLTPRVIRLPDSSPENIAKPFIAHDDSGFTTPEPRSIPQGVLGQSPQPNQ